MTAITQCEVSEMNPITGELEKVSTEGKNNIAIGTVLRFYCQGDYKDSVIIENKGIDKRFTGYGARYRTINRDTHLFREIDATDLHFPEEDTVGVHTEITKKVLPPDELSALVELATKEQDIRIKQEKEATELRQELAAKGRELAAKYIPATAKAIIVAQRMENQSDAMSDYFHVSTEETIILGTSSHCRDIFSEMRKFAHILPEVEHLATAPTTDESGDEKTEENKSYWFPSDEHREKYTGGARLLSTS